MNRSFYISQLWHYGYIFVCNTFVQFTNRFIAAYKARCTSPAHIIFIASTNTKTCTPNRVMFIAWLNIYDGQTLMQAGMIIYVPSPPLHTGQQLFCGSFSTYCPGLQSLLLINDKHLNGLSHGMDITKSIKIKQTIGNVILFIIFNYIVEILILNWTTIGSYREFR